MSPVTLYARNEIRSEYSLAPLNPHPAFPQWSLYDVYPYQFMGNVEGRWRRRAFRMV